MPSVAFLEGVGGGTAHYRCRTPGAALARRGWDVWYIEEGDDAWNADVLVINRFVGEWLPQVLTELKRRSPTLVVYDMDDWYENIPGYNRASRNVTSEQHDTVRESLRLSDVITVSTPALADGYSRFGPTVVLPNFLDPDLWGDVDRYRVPRSKVHVGWMGVVADRGGDVALLEPWLRDWLADHPGVEFVAAGCGELTERLGIKALVSPKVHEAAENWVRPYEHLPAMLAWLDVGLVPLTPNRFNECKSWCKGLEYSAAGAAVVASPSAEYRRFIEPGVNGHLVRKNDWTGALNRTLDNLDALKAGARAHAQRFFIDDHIHLWETAYARRPVNV